MSSKARGLADLGNAFDDGALSNRNLIINGAMQVAQRGTSATGKSSTGYYACDRAQVYYQNLSQMVFSVAQDSSSPDGFGYSHKVTATTAETAYSGTDLISPLYYSIEGQDLQHLKYGTSDAKPITLSFWVKSNVTGTYTVSFYKTSGANRIVAPTYTINSADTWEYKTITVEGDTAQGVHKTNATGIAIYWNAGIGSGYTSGTAASSWSTYATTNWAVGHTADFGLDANDYFQITGVQLEVGDTATPFEHRSYGQELALCQRYFYRYTGATDDRWGVSYSSSNSTTSTSVSFPVTMRSLPTGVVSSNGLLRVRDLADGAGGEITPSTVSCLAATKDRWKIAVNAQLSNAAQILAFATKLDFDAEL